MGRKGGEGDEAKGGMKGKYLKELFVKNKGTGLMIKIGQWL